MAGRVCSRSRSRGPLAPLGRRSWRPTSNSFRLARVDETARVVDVERRDLADGYEMTVDTEAATDRAHAQSWTRRHFERLGRPVRTAAVEQRPVTVIAPLSFH